MGRMKELYIEMLQENQEIPEEVRLKDLQRIHEAMNAEWEWYEHEKSRQTKVD
jgi:hypothetical protein